MSGPNQTGWLARLFGNRPKAPDVPRVRSDAEIPAAATMDRVGTFLTRRGYRFRVDEDGDITGTWEGHRFWFMLLGPEQHVLQVRGRWDRTVPPEARLALLQAMNDWNRERIWPKVYTREEGDRLAVYAEVSVDLEHGATDAQLGQVISCGLGTGVQVFSSLGTLLPPPDDEPEPEA
ncbi:hypothetical protein GCM10025864_41810 [Luteimicrobium album]|uniref:YbjN domain-containing protein n=1 Tax=Luteimicrobium album TaxID=1054550 RepID=A0ABQ6I7N6_9MICO|nr:YbjN domain-containing protein [Luteimicrobium album]GMA26422.1 hypothetical protein GCM10025864_41810 [Luteimicrobium album]